jgi:hypothetical protein
VPFTFRVPVTGPATLSASPTAELHDSSVVDVSLVSPEIPDHVDAVQLLECNAADLDRRGYFNACSWLAASPVIDNSIAPQQVAITEGLVGGGAKPSHCDPTHACVLGLFTDPDAGAEATLISNLVELSFRDPDRGTPVIKVTPHLQLTSGQVVKVNVSKIPDLVRYVRVQECNLSVPERQWQGGKPPCISLQGKAAFIDDSAGHTKVTVKAGLIGYRNTSHGAKKIFCNANTNGQCVLVAYQPEGNAGATVGIIARSAPITFAP